MFGDRKILKQLDKMLDDGISGTFEESDYDETQLSKLETKWLRYLTSSKLSAQKAEQEHERIKELVSDISHQTKTPLANILLYTQLLQEQPLDEQSLRLAEEIRQQSEKLEFLIQSLVKTSRLETGTFRLLPSENNIGSMIEQAIAMIAPKAERRQIRINYTSVECTAIFDIKWTCEAVFNIIDNAVKYSPVSSEITVFVKLFELFVCVCVEDNGIGIPQYELPRIFERFYRGQNVTEEPSGVGIGLYLSRRIVEEQGGYITAESKGSGSVFKIFLPR